MNKRTRLIKSGHTCLGGSDDDRGVTLTAADRHGSLLLSLGHSEKSGAMHIWSPYGGGKVAGGLPGFNGERTDLFTGNYLLGNGYRAYSPELMRFTCPDSLSPFGAGGINPYAYCAGDPVNITDPSGHRGMPDYFWGMMGAAFSVLGLGVALLSGGLAIAAAGGIMAAVGMASTTGLVAGGLAIASDVTALASIALEDSNPAVATALGWTSVATGLASLASGFAISNTSTMRRLQLGGEVTDFRMTNTDVGIFVDTYKGRSRLNVFAHGQYVDTTRPGQRTPIGSYLINSRADSDFGQLLSAERFVNSAKAAGVDFNHYDYIRVLACHSGDGGQASFAAKLSKLTGKPVKGYLGEVNVGPLVDPDIMYNIFNRDYLSNPSGFVQDVLAPGGNLFKIYKGPRDNYRPVYF